ncbi:MAG: DUF808 domain-containing protein [Burkholderiaceae bacterium]
MASSLLALIDDISSVLDDVALLSKLAAKKTSGVLGDDLALNAQQVSGVSAERELPVVWAVARGSLRNKAILVPAALAVSAWAPWAVTPLLMLGGAYLCYEGVEKLAHKLLHGSDDAAPAAQAARQAALLDSGVDWVALERDKIKGAIRTDFILSAEIITITLGTVAGADFSTRLMVLAGIAVLMTLGVYGLVAAIVKLDDAGLYLSRQAGTARQALGRALLAAAPWLMKALSVLGTAAMFMVGGGILNHGLPGAHDFIHRLIAPLGGGGLAQGSLGVAADMVTGLIAGALCLAGVGLVQKLLPRGKA